MGDPSTHVIFYSAYWHLVFDKDGTWVDTKQFDPICKVGDEEKIWDLEEIK
jgi:hypothetical protein